MLTGGILAVLGFGFLALKFGWDFVRKLIGMDWLVDVIATLFFMWLFGFTATISGLMAGLWAGLMVSVLLYFARKTMKHKKLIRNGSKLEWVECEGEWTHEIKNWFDNVNPLKAA